MSEPNLFYQAFERLSASLYGGYADVPPPLEIFNNFRESVLVSSQTYNERGMREGERNRPFNFSQVRTLKQINVYHAASLKAKADATVGLGIMLPDETEDEPQSGEISPEEDVLDDLCQRDFIETLRDAVEDFDEVGTGYLGVFRQEERQSSPIDYIDHIPADLLKVYVEGADTFGRVGHHYVGEGNFGDTNTKFVFARFGELDRVKEYYRNNKKADASEYRFAEVIDFRMPTNMIQWYGLMNWTAAIPAIEFSRLMDQQKYDFFLNRGLPEFFFMVLGATLDKKNRESVTKSLKTVTGQGAMGKSFYGEFPEIDLANGKDVRVVQLENQTQEDEFVKLSEMMNFRIVSAHGVPPLLAGIQVPGKLGAANEYPNALMTFQTRDIAPRQKQIRKRLIRTLGKELDLPEKAFRFRNIVKVSGLTLKQQDTMARMREPAMVSDRDLDEGLHETGNRPGGPQGAPKLAS